MRTIFWWEMRRDEIGEASRAGAAVIVPVGSIEQHGPHLPLNTDTRSALEIAERAARRITEFPVLVAPPVWWGYSPHHLDFPGAISLRVETFVNLLVEIGTSIAHHGFKKIFFLNGHGGNRGLLNTATVKLAEAGVFAAAAVYWDLITDEINRIRDLPIGSMGHACEFETSTQLRIQPENVDLRLAAGLGTIRKKASRFLGSDFAEIPRVFYSTLGKPRPNSSGISGDPSTATAEKGERFLEAAANAVATFLCEYQVMSSDRRRS